MKSQAKTVRFYLRRAAAKARALAVPAAERSVRQQNDVRYGAAAEAYLREHGVKPRRK